MANARNKVPVFIYFDANCLGGGRLASAILKAMFNQAQVQLPIGWRVKSIDLASGGIVTGGRCVTLEWAPHVRRAARVERKQADK